MHIWWTINQTMIWLTTRSEDLVEEAAPRPRGSGEPLTWFGLKCFIRCSPVPLSDDEIQHANEIDGPLSAVLHSCLSHGRIKAIRLDTFNSDPIPEKWFLGASIVFSEKLLVHVVRGAVDGESRELDVLVLSEDVRREFPFGADSDALQASPLQEQDEVSAETRKRWKRGPAIEGLRKAYPSGPPEDVGPVEITHQVNKALGLKESGLDRRTVMRALEEYRRGS